ncbi:hypothetical protein Slin15195_G044990 [Septoria linicola]|uniref:Fun14 family protein n=1 Tax=Septoria linicola TaxID=215465 RepID=A0A9Q9EHP1_9PEZI|nr:hypothetical protein Slin14017_G048510 [Septoria linicola]USW51180.1 hypothetical protein Slin15195_G044990 [Septoria linicola]
MAFRFTPGLFNHSLRTPLIFGGAAFGAGVCLAQSRILHRRPILLDSSPASISAKDWSMNQYQQDAQVPIVKHGKFNVRSVRQLSAGSIIGLVAGLAVSTFSKSLVLIIGLLVAGVQTAESYGIHIVPYKTIGRYVKGVDVRSAVQDNVALKISFGLMFALSAFAELPQ